MMNRPQIPKMLITLAFLGMASYSMSSSMAPESTDPRLKPYQQLIELDAQLCQTEDAGRCAALIKYAPKLMHAILAKTFSIDYKNGEQTTFRSVEDYRQIANSAAIYWARFITDANEKEVLNWMQFAAEYADRLVGEDENITGDDLRNAAALYHSIGIRRDYRTNLPIAEKYFQTLLDSFENDFHIADFASAANTQICFAHFEPEQAKYRYTNALNLINEALGMISYAPEGLLKMHLPFAKSLQRIAKNAARKQLCARPLATKFDAYVASIECKMAELRSSTPAPSLDPSPSPTSMMGFHPLSSSPSPTASTEGPTPDADSMESIEEQPKKIRFAASESDLKE